MAGVFVLSNEYFLSNPFVVLNRIFLCYSMEICSMTRRIPFYINQLWDLGVCIYCIFLVPLQRQIKRNA